MEITQIEQSFRHWVRLVLLEERKELEEMDQDTADEYEERQKGLKAIPTASIGQLFGILGKLSFDCPSAIGVFIRSVLSDQDDFADIDIDLIPFHWDT